MVLESSDSDRVLESRNGFQTASQVGLLPNPFLPTDTHSKQSYQEGRIVLILQGCLFRLYLTGKMMASMSAIQKHVPFHHLYKQQTVHTLSSEKPRMLDGSATLELADALLVGTESEKNERSMTKDAPDVIVRSRKKEERRLRRDGALIKLNKNAVLSLPIENVSKKVGRPVISPARKSTKLRAKRSSFVKKEADFAKGVKVVALLESIKAPLDKELGRTATLSCWAEAAGIEKKLLQQQLRVGWYCKDELLRSMRSLIVYIAKTYRAGNVGVLKGAERFDHTRGYKFATYIQYWIRKSISALISRHVRGILIPTSVNKATSQILKARAALEKGDRVHPADEEIAEFTGLSLTRIQSANQCVRVVGSVDKKISENLHIKFMEYTRDPSMDSTDKVVMQQQMRMDVHNLLQGLDLRERQAVADLH